MFKLSTSLREGSLLQALGALVGATVAVGADDPSLSPEDPQTLQNFTLGIVEDRLGDSAEVSRLFLLGCIKLLRRSIMHTSSWLGFKARC